MVTGLGVVGEGDMKSEALVKSTALLSGDIVGVWTPSSPAPALFPRRFTRALVELKSHGYQLVIGDSCHGDAGYAARPPKDIADELAYLVTDGGASAIFCAVGGWTMMPVLEWIDWELLRSVAPLIVGYSDISALLWSLLAESRLTSLHGPMVVSEWGEFGGIDPYTLSHLLMMSSGEAPLVLSRPASWTDEMLWWDKEDTRARVGRSPAEWRTLRPGVAVGPLLPGCLSTVTQLIGTPYMPDVSGAILCLETVDLQADAFWALLTQWRAAGLLAQAAALVIGRHARLRSSAAGFADTDWIVEQVVRDLRMPVLVDVDFGHTDPMLSLPVGVTARLDTDAGTIEILESAVESKASRRAVLR
jgi:muramoyltetrapeptide carboxypeptidase